MEVALVSAKTAALCLAWHLCSLVLSQLVPL